MSQLSRPDDAVRTRTGLPQVNGTTRGSSPGRGGEFLRSRRGVLALSVAALVLVALARDPTSADAGSQEASLAAALAPEGLALTPADVMWLEDAGALGSRPVIFLATAAGEEHPDLYYADVRVTSDGAVLDVSWVSNLTRSPSAAEERPIRAGDHAIYASRVRTGYDAVTVLDLRGEPDRVTAGWSTRKRMQNRVTNLQVTGRLAGFGRVRYELGEPAEALAVTVVDGRFEVRAGERTLVLDPAAVEPSSGAELVEVREAHKGEPGGISWVVDTVRALSFVGPEPIEWLQHRVFTIRDALKRAEFAVVGATDEEQSASAAADMGMSAEETRRRLELAANDPELGWPPPDVTPLISPALDNEGVWVPVVDDPFVRSYPNAPPAFYQTFFRPDAERVFARVYAVVWDPRQVQLRVMSGANEPESITGTTGRGMAPRDPETLRWFVGGFNGAFQAIHGEFGVMSEGQVFLPPKPWAATVAIMDDGRPAMGSWRGPPEGARDYSERWATDQIPDDMVEYRQNLTSVVEGNRFNPWTRWYWGAAPASAREQTYIHRTGVCMTSDGFMAYLWGESLGPDTLGQAMLSVRCIRGLHLDMNHVHAGFEFYDVWKDGEESRPPIGRELDRDAEFEGPVPEASGWSMRSRRAVTSMTQMNFPRYIARDPRDFFYLTLKPTLPGPDAGGVAFSSSGLPHAGWPHAFARASLGTGEAATWVVRVDPSRAIPDPVRPDDATRPLAWLVGARRLVQPRAGFALYSERQLVGRRYFVGAPPPEADVIVAGAGLAEAPDAGAAIGVDPDGFLVYAEGPAATLRARMRDARVEQAIALPDGVRLAFEIDGQTMGPAGYELAVDGAASVPLMANERPPTETLFPEVTPAPYAVWGWMQDRRVRYFRRSGPARFGTPQ